MPRGPAGAERGSRMVLVKVYAVMSDVAVEVTCWHGHGGEAAHLLYRERRDCTGLTFAQVLEAAAVIVHYASAITCEGQLEYDPRCLDVL